VLTRFINPPDHLPPTLRLILIRRSEPPLPLARLRARDELSELNAADLRFSLDESETFFQQTLRLPLSTEAIARLEARTEGWAAGLRLVALALEGRQKPTETEQLLATLAGEHRHILEYLTGEVLANQPESLQVFLLQTSVLNRLTASLCDVVTDRNDSASLLEQLVHANLFLTPLGGEGERLWYRHHTLFSEAMLHMARQRFGESGLQALEFAQRRPGADAHVHASLLLARIQHARGQTAQAQEMLRTLATRTRRASWLREVQAWQARFSLDAGDLDAVRRWYATHAHHTDAVPTLQQEQEALVVARLHIAEGQPEAALKLLERWRRDAQAQGRPRSELEILCLQALAHSAQADTQRAHKTLVQADVPSKAQAVLARLDERSQHYAVRSDIPRLSQALLAATRIPTKCLLTSDSRWCIILSG